MECNNKVGEQPLVHGKYSLTLPTGNTEPAHPLAGTNFINQLLQGFITLARLAGNCHREAGSLDQCKASFSLV